MTKTTIEKLTIIENQTALIMALAATAYKVKNLSREDATKIAALAIDQHNRTYQPIIDCAHDIMHESLTHLGYSQVESWTATKEKRAMASVNTPGKIKSRLYRAKTVLAPILKFDFDSIDYGNKSVISTCGQYRLQWRLRDKPDQPESYNNQQSTTGIVVLVKA